MKIKEVESITGLLRGNIRFYEDEGLLHPARSGNNYREYSEADVRRLEEIKKLRLLGISIEEIKSLYDEKLSLQEVMQKRLAQIEKEKEELAEVHKLCQQILVKKYDIHSVDQIELDVAKPEWKEMYKRVLGEDLVNVSIRQPKFNQTVSFVYAIGIIIGMVELYLLESTGFISRVVDKNKGLFAILLLVGTILVFMANKMLHRVNGKVVLIIAAVAIYPVLLYLLSHMLMRNGIFFALTDASSHRVAEYQFTEILMGGQILLTGVAWMQLKKAHENGTRMKQMLLLGALCAVLVTGVSLIICHGEWIAFEIFSQFIISLIWCECMILVWTMENKSYAAFNMFHAFSTAIDMLSPIGVLFDLRGRYGSYNMRR